MTSFSEELLVPLLPPVCAHEQDPDAIDRKQCSYAVEFGRKDFEYDKCEGELGEGSSHVGTFEGSLCSAHFDKFVRRELNATSAVSAKTEVVFWMAGLWEVSVAVACGPKCRSFM